VNYFQPDVLIVSELIDGSGAQLLLDSALNAAGVGTYSRAVFVNGPDTDNMLFYNNQKIGLKSQQQISTSLRDISHYRIFHVISAGDTAFVNLFSAHLKAGSTTQNAADRYTETVTFCNAITSISQNENLIVGGDFNMYSDQEQAWTQLTGNACSHKFYDPINMAGYWNSNSSFASIHTQSTRSNTNPGCCGGSTGGLDDRFDFLLATASVINGSAKVKYIPGTYKACGNDANHLNKALIESPSNSIVPANVATALFNTSDHLPVSMDLDIGNAVGINEFTAGKSVSVQMCMDENLNSQVCVYSDKNCTVRMDVTDVSGRKVGEYSFDVEKGFNKIRSEEMNLSAGTYIVSLFSDKKMQASCIYTQQ
jgi:hypothetical protein